MRKAGDFSPYRSLDFAERGSFCGDGDDACAVRPDLTMLTFKVTEVLGTSSKVAEGQRYVVRGEYALPESESYAVSLAVFNTAFGATAHLVPGSGAFETSVEVLDLTEDSPNGIGIVVGNKHTGSAEIVRWVMLKE